MNTCGKCHFYEAAGTGKNPSGQEFPVGTCFGAPPSVREGTTEYPTVREDRRECALWRARLPTISDAIREGELRNRGKTPERKKR